MAGKIYATGDTHGPVKLGSLDIVMSHVDYKYWIAGHYHRNAELHLKDKGRGKEMILYEQIVWIQ